MKTSKWFKTGLMAAVAVGAFAAANVFAQEEGDGKPAGPKQHSKMMMGGKGGPGCDEQGMQQGGCPLMGMGKELNLTDDQKAKIKAIMEGQKDEFQKSMKAGEVLHAKMQEAVEAGDETAAKAAAEAIGKDMGETAAKRIAIRKQVEAILTPEQKAKGEELMKARKAKMAEMKTKVQARMKERMEKNGKGCDEKEGEGCCPPPPQGNKPPPPPEE